MSDVQMCVAPGSELDTTDHATLNVQTRCFQTPTQGVKLNKISGELTQNKVSITARVFDLDNRQSRIALASWSRPSYA
jgi:hypothetical protein